MKTYRVGFASLVHDHVWGELRRWKDLPNVELVAAGDTNPRLRERIASDGTITQIFESWEEMLGTVGDSLDVVQISSENNRHADIVEACAARGLSCILEKPMAANLSQARRIADAAERAGILVMVNWPTAWSPAFQEFERRILAGEIGELRYIKYRSAHNGPREIGCDPAFVEWLYDEERNGAGAFMDYCCYGSVIAARFVGRPEKVTGMRAILAKDYPLPDDNAIVAMQFPHAYAVTEGSWTQPTGAIAPNPYAYGSGGSIAVSNGKVILERLGEKRIEIDPADPVAPRRGGPEYFLHCLETGEAPEGICALPTALQAQEILEAGLIAAATGQTQTLPLSAPER